MADSNEAAATSASNHVPIVHPIFNNNIVTLPEHLVEKDPIFKKIFHFDSDTCHLTSEELERAEKVFDEEKSTSVEFSGFKLCDFVTEWKRFKYGDSTREKRSFYGDENDCGEELNNHRVFDVRSRSYLPMKMYKPPRGRPAEFNPHAFISECDAKNNFHLLNLDCEGFNDSLDNLLCLEEGEQQTLDEIQNANNYADYNLRKIADVVTELNKMKDAGYKVLEICQESRVHTV